MEFNWDRIKGVVPPRDESHESHNLQLQHRKREQAAANEWLNSDLVFIFNGPKSRATTLKSGIERLLGQDERSLELMATQELNRGELTMGLAKADVLVEQMQAEVEKGEPSTTYLSTHLNALRRHLDKLVGCVNQ
jgi:hypothetical protein